MGKTRNKNRSPDEFLKGEIRKLKKENKQLRKELQRNYHSQDEEEIGDTEDTHPKRYLEKKICDGCGKGEVVRLEIVGRIFETCPICGERKKVQ